MSKFLHSIIMASVTIGMYWAPYSLADSTKLTVCYNFGCKSKGIVQPTPEDMVLLENLFAKASSPGEERGRIRQAIAKMEQIAARYLPTGNDIGGNYTQDMVEEGKQDCIDESTNTTTYLNFFYQHGWLHWHTIEDRIFRAPFIFDDHWAAQIRERDTGHIYVVDSWYRDNGQPPIIQTLEDWQRKRNVRD